MVWGNPQNPGRWYQMKKIDKLFKTWLEYNEFDEMELDADSLCYVYAQLEEGTPIEDVEYFG